MSIEALRAEQREAFAKADQIYKTTERDRRAMTDAEQRSYTHELARVEHLREEIDAAGIEPRRRATEPVRTVLDDGGLGAGTVKPRAEYKRAASGHILLEQRDSVEALACEEWHRRAGFPVDEARELDLGRYIRGLATGDWTGAELEQRAMATTPISAGGAIVPLPLSGRIVDLARNKTQVIQAGATEIFADDFSSSTLTIARVLTDPQPAWKAENAEGVTDEGTYDQIVLTARTIFLNVKMSVELAVDGINSQTLIEKQIAKAIAEEVDRAGLYGSGIAPEPQGIKGSTGVNALDIADPDGAVLAGYDPISQLVETVRNANLEPTALLYNARTQSQMERLKDTTNQPLQPPMSLQKIPSYVTNQIPNNLTVGASTDCTDVFTGDWRSLFVGWRSQLQVEMSTEASDSSSSAWTGYQLWIRGVARVDFGLSRGDHFGVLSGLLPDA